MEESDKLHSEATELLGELDLVVKLELLGEVELTGSYAYNLMAWPDIDIAVYADNFSRASINELVSSLLQHPNIFSLKYTDYAIRKAEPGYPRDGLYVGLEALYKEKKWKIDCWLIKTINRRSEDRFVKGWDKQLSEEQRQIILNIKYQLLAKNRYPGKRSNPGSISSAEIYSAVLDGVKNEDELYAWLKSTK